MPIATPGQTIGPFFGYALPYRAGADLVPPGHLDAIRLTGRVLDGSGTPVPDALLEIWQADQHGAVVRRPGSLSRDGWAFTGFGRCPTDNAGGYSFTTVRPGPTDPERAPFIAMTVFARGLLNRLCTRVYLPGHDQQLTIDPVLSALPDKRRRTLIAHAQGRELHFDVHLQGAHETVFLQFERENR